MSGQRPVTIAIVQARTGSTRLPGKVLMDLHGAPMILRQLERVRRAESLNGIVVATSDDPGDDDLTRVVQEAGYDVVRGSRDDVLARFIAAIDVRGPDAVVRITADCPLIDAHVIDQVVGAFQVSETDYLSNTMVPTYPDGLDVEVCRAEVLRDVATRSTDPDEREHVTLGIYRRPDEFQITNFVDPTGDDHSHLRWTVDTADDFAFVQRIYGALFARKPQFEYADVLEVLAQHPGWSRTDDDAKRNAALDGLDTGAMQR